MKNRVLSINSTTRGSTGRIMRQISETARKDGFQSFIAFRRGVDFSREEAIRIGNQNTVRFHGLVTRMTGKHGFSSKKATRAFLKEIDKIDPDLIHLHNVHGYYLNIELLFGYIKEKSIPVIWTLHDCWAFTGHCAHFDYIGCEKWISGCNNCPQIHAYPRSLLIDYSKKAYERKKKAFTGVEDLTIVTTTSWHKDLVARSFLGEYEVKVIHNGVDTDVFVPANVRKSEFGIYDDKFVVLGVAAKFTSNKGFKVFKELSARIEDDTIIFLVGLDDKQIRQLPKNVRGVRSTESIQELAKIYSMADVFVNPSLQEVFGLVNAEALACGTPVVTFQAGGTVETVDDKSGFVVKRGDIDGLLRAIAVVKAKGKNTYVNSCRQRAMEHFMIKNMCKKYLSLYSMKLQK